MVFAAVAVVRAWVTVTRCCGDLDTHWELRRRISIVTSFSKRGDGDELPISMR